MIFLIALIRKPKHRFRRVYRATQLTHRWRTVLPHHYYFLELLLPPQQRYKSPSYPSRRPQCPITPKVQASVYTLKPQRCCRSLSITDQISKHLFKSTAAVAPSKRTPTDNKPIKVPAPMKRHHQPTRQPQSPLKLTLQPAKLPQVASPPFLQQLRPLAHAPN